MKKLLIILITIVNCVYAANNYLYRDNTENIQLEVHQTLSGIYISDISFTNQEDACFVNLNFNKQQVACNTNIGVNFCNYEINGPGYKISGLISLANSIYPTAISLTGTIYQNGCAIKRFPSTQLNLY